MKFSLSNAHGDCFGTVEVESIEDLRKISENNANEPLVVYFNFGRSCDEDSIIIYDYWLE